MRLGFIGLGAMGLPMTRNLLAAGHQVTVASRGRGPIDAAVALGALDGGWPGRGGRGQPGRLPLRAQLARGDRGGGRHGRVARTRPGGGRLLHHRSRGRTRPARAGDRDRRRLPGRSAFGRHGRRGGGHADRDGGRGRRHPGAGAPGARAGGGPGGARGRPGHGPGGQAVQQPDLRGPDGGHGRGQRRWLAARARTWPSSTRCWCTPPATAWPCAPGSRWAGWCPTARRPTVGRPGS